MKLGYLVIGLILLSGCSSQSDNVKDQEEVEAFPDVNLKEFDTVHAEGEFQFIVPDFVSRVTPISDRGILELNHLAKEYHIYVEKIPESEYIRSLKARNMSARSPLKEFTEECKMGFMGRLKDASCSEVKTSVVNEMNCHRFELEGNSYGFPLPKIYFIRCFKGKRNLYTVVCWTVEKNRKQFEKLFLATGLSFREKD